MPLLLFCLLLQISDWWPVAAERTSGRSDSPGEHGRLTLDHQSGRGNLSLVKRPVRVAPLSGEKISVAFSDGLEGVIDMSSSVGRGVFAPLADPKVFATVHIGDHGQIAWSDEMENDATAGTPPLHLVG
jgi:hypothetical protein